NGGEGGDGIFVGDIQLQCSAAYFVGEFLESIESSCAHHDVITLCREGPRGGLSDTGRSSCDNGDARLAGNAHGVDPRSSRPRVRLDPDSGHARQLGRACFDLRIAATGTILEFYDSGARALYLRRADQNPAGRSCRTPVRSAWLRRRDTR